MAIVYTGKEAVQELIAKLKAYADSAADNAASNISLWTVVSALPTADIDTGKIYLLPAENTEDGNIYAEYIYVNGSWEKFGEMKLDVDLSDYAKTSEVAAQIESSLTDYVTSSSLSSTLSSYAKTSDLSAYAKESELSDYAKTDDFEEITAADIDAMF